MTPETSRQAGSGDIHVTSHDHDGAEIFPTEDLAMVLTLPYLLEAELEHPARAARRIVDDIDILTDNLQVSHNRALNLSIRDRLWLEIQLEAQKNVISDLESRNGRFAQPYKRIKAAMADIAPAEISYFENLVRAGQEPSDADYVHAGKLDRPSKISQAFGKGPRFYADTPENLVMLEHVVGASQRLLLLENHDRASTVLDLCCTFGDRRQVHAAITLAKRLQRISCDDGLSIEEKMTAQAKTNASVAQLARSLSYSHADEATLERAHTRISHFEEIAEQNFTRSQVLSMMVYGKRFRLNGNSHPVEPPAEEEDLPSDMTVEVISPGIPEVTEPEPDYAAEYGARLSEVTGTVDFKKFESLPTNEIKRRELEEARAVLVKGEDDEESGETIVGGRSKLEVHRYISSVEFLRSFIPDSGSVPEGRQALKEAVEASKAYAARVKAVLDEAAGHLSTKELANLGARVPDIKPLEDVVSYIKGDWETASYVIENYWPDGREAVEQLRQLLFVEDEPAELQHGQEVNLSGQ